MSVKDLNKSFIWIFIVKNQENWFNVIAFIWKNEFEKKIKTKQKTEKTDLIN